MAIIPEKFQEDLDRVLQDTMSYDTLGANRFTVTKKVIEELHELNKPRMFDNYIDVMQQYIDLVQNILSTESEWAREIDNLYKYLSQFFTDIEKLTAKWMGMQYRNAADFLEPLKELPINKNIPESVIPFCQDLKDRLIGMTEKNTSSEHEKAKEVWTVCQMLKQRAMKIASSLKSMMEQIYKHRKIVVSVNLREIIARASPSTTSGGRRTRHKRSNKKRSGHKRSGKSNKRMSRRR